MKSNNNWQPIVKVGRTVPFGYEQSPDDPKILLPVVRELELLEQAKRYLKEFSFRKVAEWLTQQSGRYISNEGLRKRVKSELTRRKRANNLRTFERDAKKKAEAAKKLESRIGGRAARGLPGGDILPDLDPWRGKSTASGSRRSSQETDSDLRTESGATDRVPRIF